MTQELSERRRAAVGRWSVVVLVALVVPVLVALSGATQGTCYDSATDPAASYCTYGPLIAPTAFWFFWALWGAVAIVTVAWAARGALRR